MEEKLRISTKNVIHVGEVFYQSTYHFLLKVVVVMMAGEGGYSYGDHCIFKLSSGYSCYFEGIILRVELREENTFNLTGGKTPSYKNNSLCLVRSQIMLYESYHFSLKFIRHENLQL